MQRVNRTESKAYCVAVTFLLLSHSAGAAAKPNIVVFYTDDHGYADLSCQGVFDDVKTPHVDALAASGVRALHGYSTAPQCVPSRAGLMIGKFQSRFGVESNGQSMAGFNAETTIAQRLAAAGYVTAQFGKWHLGPNTEITNHGFRYFYAQNSQAPFTSNITTDGRDRPISTMRPEGYHVIACSKAAAAVIERHHDEPLFLYVAYRAPHVPLDATPEYLARFPGEMPERRRQALAMLSAVDDGVGLVMAKLSEHQLTENTLVFYIGDNGAPLKIHKFDAPGRGPGWDGSLNDPLNGEKGMLTEGGMHTPFVVSWPGTIPGGQLYKHPVSALDVAATAAAIAEIETNPGDLDGVNLTPFLSGAETGPPHEALMWRWINQAAIREGDWKYLRGSGREYLFDLSQDLEETTNVADAHPDVLARLKERLTKWSDELSPPGLQTGPGSAAAKSYFDFYLDGKEPVPLREKFQPKSTSRTPDTSNNEPAWIVRNGQLTLGQKMMTVTSSKNASGRDPFLARAGLRLRSPATVSFSAKTATKGPIVISWRTKGQAEFSAERRTTIEVLEPNEWQQISTTIEGEAPIIHVRIQLPTGESTIRNLNLAPSQG